VSGRKWESNIVGVLSLTTTETSVELAHGLGAAPTFVLAGLGTIASEGADQNTVSWEATATTVTFTAPSTAGSKTIAYMIAL
jgi:hypothetical protein